MHKHIAAGSHHNCVLAGDGIGERDRPRRRQGTRGIGFLSHVAQDARPLLNSTKTPLRPKRYFSERPALPPIRGTSGRSGLEITPLRGIAGRAYLVFVLTTTGERLGSLFGNSARIAGSLCGAAEPAVTSIGSLESQAPPSAIGKHRPPGTRSSAAGRR